jgi:hypothetical protein
MRMWRSSFVGAFVVVATGLVVHPSVRAAGGADDQAEQAARCSVRLSLAILGTSPESALLASPAPQASVDAMLTTPTFIERFASFMNSELSKAPSADPSNDPVYALTKYVLTENKPWTDLFVGPYALAPSSAGMDVSLDERGLGYFRSDVWRKDYAGNDEGGALLVAAFRIVQNTTGLTLTPSVGVAGQDRSLTGRQAVACRGCHFDSWYALDRIASLLPKRKTSADGTITLTPRNGGPQALLGKTITDDKDLVETLVNSDAWRFPQCRHVFHFLYGRNETQCEASVFDACVDALTSTKTIQGAIASVAKDPSFCAN